MKARVKKTGEIVIVSYDGIRYSENGAEKCYNDHKYGDCGRIFGESELELMPYKPKYEISLPGYRVEVEIYENKPEITGVFDERGNRCEGVTMKQID